MDDATRGAILARLLETDDFKRAQVLARQRWPWAFDFESQRLTERLTDANAEPISPEALAEYRALCVRNLAAIDRAMREAENDG